MTSIDFLLAYEDEDPPCEDCLAHPSGVCELHWKLRANIGDADGAPAEEERCPFDEPEAA